MYFVRVFQSGIDRDVRSKRWAEFKCDNCQKEDHVDVTGMANFNFSKPRRCPSCGCLDAEDMSKNIKKQIEQLIKEINQAEQKKIALEKELTQYCKNNSNN